MRQFDNSTMEKWTNGRMGENPVIL